MGEKGLGRVGWELALSERGISIARGVNPVLLSSSLNRGKSGILDRLSEA